MILGNLPGGRVQLPSPSIVAKPFPKLEYLVFVGRGQVGYAGKRLKKPLEIRNHGRHLRLLQHDLADPHPIGIRRLPPG